MNKDQNDEQRALERKVREIQARMTKEDRLKMFKKVLEGNCYEAICDFLVVEKPKGSNFTSPTIIMHLPTGTWREFSLPYDVAVEMVKNQPDKHQELADSILGA